MVLASGRVFADETTVPVLDPGRGKTKTDFLPIVKLERMRRGGNPAGLLVSGSHRISMASGGDYAASASDLIEPRVRARDRQDRFAPPAAVAVGQP
jgi:hypothetical protein